MKKLFELVLTMVAIWLPHNLQAVETSQANKQALAALEKFKAVVTQHLTDKEYSKMARDGKGQLHFFWEPKANQETYQLEKALKQTDLDLPKDVKEYLQSEAKFVSPMAGWLSEPRFQRVILPRIDAYIEKYGGKKLAEKVKPEYTALKPEDCKSVQNVSRIEAMLGYGEGVAASMVRGSLHETAKYRRSTHQSCIYDKCKNIVNQTEKLARLCAAGITPEAAINHCFNLNDENGLGAQQRGPIFEYGNLEVAAQILDEVKPPHTSCSQLPIVEGLGRRQDNLSGETHRHIRSNGNQQYIRPRR